MRVLQIIRDEEIAHERDAFEFVASFRHDLFDFLRTLHIDRDDARFRRREIRSKPEEIAFISDEVVSRILFVEQLDHFPARMQQILVEDLVLRIGAVRNADDQIRAIFGYLGGEEPILVILCVRRSARPATAVCRSCDNKVSGSNSLP